MAQDLSRQPNDGGFEKFQNCGWLSTGVFLFVAVAFARIIELDGRDSFRGQIISRSDNGEIGSLED